MSKKVTEEWEVKGSDYKISLTKENGKYKQLYISSSIGGVIIDSPIDEVIESLEELKRKVIYE